MKLGKAAAFASLLLMCSTSHAVEHWTAEVGKITVFEDGSAFMIVSNPRGGPVGTFGCAQNVVYLGVKNVPAPKALLAHVMTVHTSAVSIRFGIRGTADSCEAYYVTSEP